MGRFRNSLQSSLIPAVSPWLDYIETGKPPLQEAMGGVETEHRHWITTLAKRLNSPRRLDGEDRRALHLLTGHGEFLTIAHWVAQDLPRELPDEDLHGMLRAEMAHAGSSETAIAGMTLAFFREFITNGSPNSAGSYVLGLSDQQFVDAARMHDYDRHLRDFEGVPAFFGLVEFLFEFAPSGWTSSHRSCSTRPTSSARFAH